MKSGVLIFILTVLLALSLLTIFHGYNVWIPEAEIRGWENAQKSFESQRREQDHLLSLADRDRELDSLKLQDCRDGQRILKGDLGKQITLTDKANTFARNWEALAKRVKFSFDSLRGKHALTLHQIGQLEISLQDTTALLQKERQLRDLAEAYAYDIRQRLLSETANRSASQTIIPPIQRKKTMSSLQGDGLHEPMGKTDLPSGEIPSVHIKEKQHRIFFWILFPALLFLMALIARRRLIKTAKAEKRKRYKKNKQSFDPVVPEEGKTVAPRQRLSKKLFFGSENDGLSESMEVENST